MGEEKKVWTRDELNEIFNKYTLVKIVFNKLDGTERVMRATRNGQHIPMEHWPVYDGVVARHDMQVNVKVFDIDAKGWRTIRPESVLTVESLGEEV